jgi:hypothetical protein
VEGVHALHGLALRLVCPKEVSHVDPADHQHAVLLHHLAPDIGRKGSLAGLDSARLQRATEGAGESAAGRGHDVVERGRDLTLGLDPIVLLDGTMHTELDRAFVGR